MKTLQQNNKYDNMIPFLQNKSFLQVSPKLQVNLPVVSIPLNDEML